MNFFQTLLTDFWEFTKVVLLTGSRQCGKSTCMEHLANDAQRERLNLDNEILLTEAKESADQFLVHHKFPVFIDEIQRAPNLFLQIKAKVDEMKSYGQVWASGSQKFALMKGVADSLAGRICPLDLMPLSRRFKHETQQGGSCVDFFCLTCLQVMFGSRFWKLNGGPHLWEGPFIFQSLDALPDRTIAA